MIHPLERVHLEVWFWPRRRTRWQTSDTSWKRSSRNFVRLKFCAARECRWRMWSTPIGEPNCTPVNNYGPRTDSRTGSRASRTRVARSSRNVNSHRSHVVGKVRTAPDFRRPAHRSGGRRNPARCGLPAASGLRVVFGARLPPGTAARGLDGPDHAFARIAAGSGPHASAIRVSIQRATASRWSSRSRRPTSCSPTGMPAGPVNAGSDRHGHARQPPWRSRTARRCSLAPRARSSATTD